MSSEEVRRGQASQDGTRPDPDEPITDAPARFPDRWEIVRDQLCQQIADGVYPPGVLLPSGQKIMETFGVSTTTARRVLDNLATTGWARKDGTRGHISNGVPTAPGPAQPAIWQQQPAQWPWQGAAANTGLLAVRPRYTIPADSVIPTDTNTRVAAVTVNPETPPAEAALALQLADPTAPVIVRRRLLTDPTGTPVQLRTSYLPLAVAEGTPLSGPHPVPEPWPIALARYTGLTITHTTSTITARHPIPADAALGLPPHAVVLIRTDTHHTDETPADHTVTAWPGDTTYLTTDHPNTTD